MKLKTWIAATLVASLVLPMLLASNGCAFDRRDDHGDWDHHSDKDQQHDNDHHDDHHDDAHHDDDHGGQ